MNDEYLAFVDEIGRTIEGDYVYRLDFTYDPESVWGDYFNSVPSVIVPDLQPDINSLSSNAKIVVDRRLSIAKKNGCFSMQDCIDGIISLCFTDIDEEPLVVDNEAFKLDFGESFESVSAKLEKFGIKLEDKQENDVGSEEIDRMIENMTTGLRDDFVILNLSVGDEITRDEIKEKLYKNGYKNVDLVEKNGEYAIRGFMIDIFSYEEDYPYRVNFFGDNIESIFSFDFNEGKKVEDYDEIKIYRKGLL